ncbi:class I adenylate-forming enzyme family protein [Actinorugispora endophytica]|uniref:Acyl-CoA synthetase (AMP-forming)/AMP-acid ligase II n=1 Tax=Actinorugispora endophytica TaxID=1605990 RepID=A0A4R6V3F7_9ACTN|nr:class I adenylate-forming enzyme family protein [Actinorugispora endophytica]TDQ53281.1 acyl-CoA synthetase (AMP-forming)/AMP-acid ligase II [Actinorugispora endophytica]
MKFHEYFESNADAFPERTAATFDGKSVVYGELDALAERHRAALVGHGARPGDRVVLYAELSAEAVAAVIGILKAGCVVVTTHPSFDRRKLVHQAREADAAFLVTDRPDVFEGVFDETPLDAVLPLGGGPEAEPLLRRRPPAVPRSDDAGIPLEGELAALFYTSGSSSAPKGVAVSHGNMVAAFEAVTSYQANTADDVVLTFTPIGSDFGFHNVMMPLAFGGRVVACRALPEDPRALIDLVDRERVTGIHAFPPVLARLCGLDDLHRYEVPSLRYVSSSGQRLPVEHIRRLRDAFPRVLIHSMYGLTECKRVAYLPPDEIDRHPDSVGRPLPGVRAHIVGDDGRPVTEPGAVGELAVAGDLVMQGYWRRPELTRRVIRRDVLGESRLLLTGDLFRRDRDGLLYWVARRDEVFARSVFKVDPHEVEARIRELPGVADCAVVPVADDSAGSVPVACVVPRDRAGVGEREVIDHCAERLDWHMVPARVVFHRRLPLTASGKTDRRALARALEESGRDGAKGGAR